MAIVGVFTNALVLVNTVDLSYACQKVTVKDDRDEVNVDAMGVSYHQVTKGLGTAEIDLDFLQDLSPAKVHYTLQPLIGSAVGVAIEIRAVNAARSAANPAFMMASGLLFSYVPLDGQIGTAANFTATFKNAPGGTGITYLQS
jgi:hypothetical protein